MPTDSPNNRLGVARWLVDPQHPLTSRVAVNRLWQMLFGAGLVTTVEDFGSQGAMPTHPEMLDHLAREYVRLGWDTKALLKQLVTSATYRQSSQLSPELQQTDPDNRLLARGPRVRLSAEMIRDQALFASGLLVESVGGPSVRPYQPADLWKDLTENAVFVQDHGDKLYRRGMYTFWKRTVAPPSMVAFDASTREFCTVRESRTNTPLQALTLLNDVTYVEAARKLAERACATAPDATAAARLTRAFQLLTARQPKPAELAVLLKGFEHHRGIFQQHPERAVALLTTGESSWDQQYEPAELAAYATVASMLLNLDEVINKE